MGIKKVDRNEVIDFVSIHDDAIDVKAMGDALTEYIKTRAFKLLKFSEGKAPTIFKLKPNMTVRGAAKVQNNSFAIGKGKGEGDDDSDVKVLFGNISLDSLKQILVGIENPPDMKKGEGIEFKKDGQGIVMDSCLEEIPNLLRIEISTFYLALQKAAVSGALKKS